MSIELSKEKKHQNRKRKNEHWDWYFFEEKMLHHFHQRLLLLPNLVLNKWLAQ